MSYVIDISQFPDHEPREIGGKAAALGRLYQRDFHVPAAAAVTAEAYDTYVSSTGLADRIGLELGKKDFRDMRWEEIWDASLRIRNLFLTTPLPEDLAETVRKPLERLFDNRPVAVRSSAPGEDSSEASFAGLHESYLNIRGIDAVLDHIRLVWASLWSDAALLYRQELGLDVHSSTMAVLVQEFIIGDRSGVVFGRDPSEKSRVIIEAIHGLNQGFVDGIVAPDRWYCDRATGGIISHEPAERLKEMAPTDAGISLRDLSGDKKDIPPLDDKDIGSVYRLAMEAERIFGTPQDVEWTLDESNLYTLQARPITATSDAGATDDRHWYRSLSRSFENLRELQTRIEDDLIPAMIRDAERLSAIRLPDMNDGELAREIEERIALVRDWEEAYREYFIPFAHGMRLFGTVYNDTVRPRDPYEFMDLLSSSTMLSVTRNRMLEEMADVIRHNDDLRHILDIGGDTTSFTVFMNLVETFVNTFGDLTCYSAQCSQSNETVLAIAREMASKPPQENRDGRNAPRDNEDRYLSFFPDEKKLFARDLLALARASYRLRDDDNIHLGRIQGGLAGSVNEGNQRLAARAMALPGQLAADDVATCLRDPGYRPRTKTPDQASDHSPHERVQARQLIGQPAGPGIATGRARVIGDTFSPSDFTAGEIIVCDAIDPNMTFLIPLAAGIVERRGGMLIHGAIIAREYGLPCVTGVPEAIHLISTGDRITVDGYLGIVVLS